MELTIEFAGLSRVLTHLSSTSLTVEPGTTFRQIIAILSSIYPELIGEVIHTNLQTLQASNMLNVNGKHMVQPTEMEESPADGDRVILMSILAGG
jgi:molybdopterin converting factor small subunit